jgi:hypothetical protein
LQNFEPSLAENQSGLPTLGEGKANGLSGQEASLLEQHGNPDSLGVNEGKFEVLLRTMLNVR